MLNDYLHFIVNQPFKLSFSKHKGNNHKIQDALQERTVLEQNRLTRRVSRKRQREVTEIDPGQSEAQGRHDDVFDKGRNDLAERSANNNANGKINDVALDSELLELRCQTHENPLRCWMPRHRSSQQGV